MSDPKAMDPRDIWRNQPVEGTALTVEEVRDRAQSFEKTIRRRNLREYVAAVFVLLFFGGHAAIAAEVSSRAGSALIVAGTIFVIFQLRRRGTPGPAPADAALRPCVDFHRAELARQRDLLRGVWAWYLLPLVPGLAVLLGGRILAHPEGAWWVGSYAVLCALLFIAIGWLNWIAARGLQRDIDEMEAQP